MSGRGDLLPLALVLAAVVVAFWPVLRAGFFWDDTYYVVRNPVVQGDGTVPLRAVFTTPVLGHWHPLTIGSLALDRAVWGPGWHARAGLKAEAGDRAGAVRDLDEAVRVLPTAAASLAFRGNLKADLGDPNGAVADYAAALRLDPNDAETHYNQGYLELEQGRAGAAILAFTRAIALDPRLVPAWFNRGEARARTGDPSGALADYGEALLRDRGFAPALHGRARVRLALGDVAGAAADLAGAARLRFPIDQALARAIAARSDRNAGADAGPKP